MNDSTPLDLIPQAVKVARGAFGTGITLETSFRKRQLQQLFKLLTEERETLRQALFKDLRKPAMEGVIAELIASQNEVVEALENLEKWVTPDFPRVPLINKGDKCQIQSQPFGVCLIIGAWNYPLQLIFLPLIGAISAGNCAILKPSELAPHSAQVLSELIPRYLNRECYHVIKGGIPETSALLEIPFDMILYTGSSHVGKIVMNAASKHLTPVVLELGGKSPAIVDQSANLHNTARRIAWGKFANSGQTCIAPDYVICLKGQEDLLIKEFKSALLDFYGSHPQKSDSYPRIVNKNHFRRIKALLEGCQGKVVCGGEMDEEDLFISPTLVLEPSLDSSLMKEEIFGPVLPIILVDSVNDAIRFVNDREKPLALYVFSSDQKVINTVLKYTSSGGACVNDVLMHASVAELPFGGVGNSGMGAYHGKKSFDTFSHKRSLMMKSMNLEFLNSIRYPPYSLPKFNQVVSLLARHPSKLSFPLLKFLVLLLVAFFLVRNPQNRFTRSARVLLGFE